MDTLLAILSFPFWVFGIFFMILAVFGEFGKIKVNGVPVYNQSAYGQRLGILSVGFILIFFAYTMVNV